MKKFTENRPKPVHLGVMTMCNGNIELKAIVATSNRRQNSDLMLRIDASMPRRYRHNIKLISTPYKLSININEVKTDSNSITEFITKQYMLKDKFSCTLLPGEKWVNSTGLFISIAVTYDHLKSEEPTKDVDFVTISSSPSRQLRVEEPTDNVGFVKISTSKYIATRITTEIVFLDPWARCCVLISEAL